jgi:hypothetical protein
LPEAAKRADDRIREVPGLKREMNLLGGCLLGERGREDGRPVPAFVAGPDLLVEWGDRIRRVEGGDVELVRAHGIGECQLGCGGAEAGLVLERDRVVERVEVPIDAVRGGRIGGDEAPELGVVVARVQTGEPGLVGALAREAARLAEDRPLGCRLFGLVGAAILEQRAVGLIAAPQHRATGPVSLQLDGVVDDRAEDGVRLGAGDQIARVFAGLWVAPAARHHEECHGQ